MQYLISSGEALVQFIATNMVTKGYFFYVSGVIPERKDPLKTDRKMLAAYNMNLPRAERVRRKRHGLANIRYVRLGHYFLMMATDGDQSDSWFTEHAGQVRDIRQRRHALIVQNYEIRATKERMKGGRQRWRPRVAIERKEFKRQKAYFLELAVHRQPSTFIAEFKRLPFQPYRTVRGQLLDILICASRVRHKAGYSRIQWGGLLKRRRTVMTVFTEQEAGQIAA